MPKLLKQKIAKKAPAQKRAVARKPTTPKKIRCVYNFGDGKADGNGSMKPLLGGKGANLHEMTRIGLPVPPGFTITTEVCTYFYANKKYYPPELEDQVATALAKIEKSAGKKLGDHTNPLLVSVRSGARDSMPGMMDTILNLGMNDEVVEIVAEQSGNPRFAWDSYRRFLQTYGDVVMGVQKRATDDHEPFETIIEEVKHAAHAEKDTDLSADDLKTLVERFEQLIQERTRKTFPQDPRQQLWELSARYSVPGRPSNRLSPEIWDSSRLGHGGERANDGLWQPRQHQRHGRRLYAGPGNRREDFLRRVPH